MYFDDHSKKLLVRCVSTPPYFLVSFTKGKIFCYFLFASQADVIARRWANSFL